MVSMDSDEMADIAKIMKAINETKTGEVSIHVKISVYGIGGSEIGTIENFRDDGDDVLLFYPASV